MITYLPDGPIANGKYGFSYQQLRDDFVRFQQMTDEEFYENALGALHFAVFVCYIKEAPGYRVLSDTGIIHELVHLVCEQRNRRERRSSPEVTTTPIPEIRTLFNTWCALAD